MAFGNVHALLCTRSLLLRHYFADADADADAAASDAGC